MQVQLVDSARGFVRDGVAVGSADGDKPTGSS